ncbi:hypothetical protein KSF_072660 [Reticulibacter mediterranei]|uniref:Uncharacterized protein n=1 Tax=Reticulibacter mediterranei TaxID=2778369 RepID=A0A8J3INB5_9CHLR|nr:hypothetical protein [Reticulibacter mediterranei]GHO97218.1 hypothetical protein KSF_072660 [Reticulibacter mediterranei]
MTSRHTIGAVLAIASCVALLTIVSPLSASARHIQRAPSHQQLFLILQGISSELTPEQAAANQGMGLVPQYWETGNNGVPGIVPFLQKEQFPNASFFVYSYQGNASNGNPLPYDCTQTFSHPLRADILALNRQITSILTNNPNFKGKQTDVYLIGHSLGGVVAFGYLAYLKSLGGLNGSLPKAPKARLKGVVTLDSPIGGVSGNRIYQKLIRDVFGRPQGCPGIKSLPHLTSVDNLVQIFSTTPKRSDPHGAKASLLQAIFHDPKQSNQTVAETARIPILTVGNTHDLIWDPRLCGIDGDFRSTQWVEDEASNHLAVYGRDFTEGKLICNPKDFQSNHLAVLHTSQVETGLNQFFPSGGVPTALTIASLHL